MKRYGKELNDLTREQVFEQMVEARGLDKAVLGRFHKMVREMAQLTLVEVGEAAGVTKQAVGFMESGRSRLSYEGLLALEKLLGRDLLQHVPATRDESFDDMRERLLAHMATLEEVVAYRANMSEAQWQGTRAWLKDTLQWHGIPLQAARNLPDGKRVVRCLFTSSSMTQYKFRLGQLEAIEAALAEYVVCQQPADEAFLARSRRHASWVAQRVREVRSLKDMSTSALADVLGWGQPRVCNFENGTASRGLILFHRRHAEAVITHLGVRVSPEELFLPQEGADGQPLRGPGENVQEILAGR
ncbi:MAG: helix-turn-helix transcriptional regulator [Pseudomonadaceae bacterium]|nr:helix-turn-helix transcriptional regulator [Pseudomonadaceae bacterium]